MVKNLRSVSTYTTIKEVADILVKKEYHSLPVVEGSKQVDIVTITDLIKYLLE